MKPAQPKYLILTLPMGSLPGDAREFYPAVVDYLGSTVRIKRLRSSWKGYVLCESDNNT